MEQFNIDTIEAITMNGLKDFQRKTVERIDYLFRHGQSRVLIADEVGLGKTLIARGAIVKTARIRLEEQDDLFKVVYVCSNIAIANQNIQKLRVSDSARVEHVTDTRLSMLHLKLAQQQSDECLHESFIQLIPLTPDTSFRVTAGGGTLNERALMFVILSRMDELAGRKAKLNALMDYKTCKYWPDWVKEYERQVAELESLKELNYPENLIESIRQYKEAGANNTESCLLQDLIDYLSDREIDAAATNEDTNIIGRLRTMFARIGAELLEPDLVIMDEFQRFKYLLDSEQNSDTGILAKQFLSGNNTRVLLLSATPYKLYSTLEEIDEAKNDEHFSEFLQVMDFLFEGNKEEFRNIWSDYSGALNRLHGDSTAIIEIKDAAEAYMYQGVCRTERFSVIDSDSYEVDNRLLKPTTADIQSYLDAGTLLKDIGINASFPVDYVKSSPFLMSFMRNYQEKKKIEAFFKASPEALELANKDLLWVDVGRINRYAELPDSNARLNKLTEHAFDSGAELLLWVPPSMPYYELHGAFKSSRGFSKILVFSSWEMVPRMIGTMLSYEAERRTIGRLREQNKNFNRNSLSYTAKYRYPHQRLSFSLSSGEPQRMNLFSLLYPSKTLACLFDPVAAVNAKQSLADIERQIKLELRRKLDQLKQFENPDSRKDDSWYYLAPMLMDGSQFVNSWIAALESAMKNEYKALEDKKAAAKNNKIFSAHIEQLKERLNKAKDQKLGQMPEDLLSTLTDMVIGSPAVCILRSNGGNVSYATSLARVFINYFNSTESTAVIEVATDRFHAKKADDMTHWQDVLMYCKDGCFQAMFDEYLHIIRENVSFLDQDKCSDRMQNIMLQDLRFHTASYDVDTYKVFHERMNGIKGKKDTLKMRAHYAVGFSPDTNDENIIARKENIRGAFNSPLRPFILATTSIGQEGLDFHNYCRKVMHWNLPSNPIDLEQREGRVNRFKCLAVRQNVAQKYGEIRFSKDIWTEMFDAAQAEKKPGQSDLVPFWCFGDDPPVKIERIVPMYPMSKDVNNYERLIKILSLYRLTLGQPRQEELLEYLFHNFRDTTELKKLFINLSPFSKE